MKTILRPDEHGEPDDFVITDVTLFRMERMDDGYWWLAVYRGDERVSVFLSADCPITCNVAEDDLGLVNDGGNDVLNKLLLEDAE